MELILFIYMLVIVVVTGHILLVREAEDGHMSAAVPVVHAVAADLLVREAEDAITSADAARLIKWAEDGHMSAAAPVVPVVPADDDLFPGEEEDKWEDLAEDWEFPVIGKKQSPVIMTVDCRCNRALRGCGRRGKGKQKGGKHIDKKRLRRADTKAHLSLLEELI